MRRNYTFKGSIFCQRGRYYWKVKDPQTRKRRTFALKPAGSRFATQDKRIAKEIAQRKWDSWQATGGGSNTIGELIELYLKYVKETNAQDSAQPYKVELALRLIDNVSLPPCEYSPLLFDDTRQKLINKGITAHTINTKMRFIIKMFKWAASREIVSPLTPYALENVEKVKNNHPKLRRTKIRQPAPLEDVRRTLAYLHPILRAMVITQLYTGTRPSEMLRMKPCDIDTSDEIWVYTQNKHKTDYKDGARPRIIPLNKQVQNVLIPLIAEKKQNEYLFSPADGREVATQIRNDCRQTPRSCGNRRGKSSSYRPGGLQLRECYDHGSYRTAIRRAIMRLNRDLKARDGDSHTPMPIWTPYQLRHAAATAINAVDNVDALGFAQALLGHKNRSTTEIYAKMGLEKAKRAAEILNEIEI